MPSPTTDLIVMPDTAPVSVRLEPAHSVSHSLWLLNRSGDLSGLDDWVTHTASALSPEEKERHELVGLGLYYAVLPMQSWPSFPAYIDHLASLNPVALRDKLMHAYARFPRLGKGECKGMVRDPFPIDVEAVLDSVDAYLGFLRERFDAAHMDDDLESRAYAYVMNPPAMQALIVSHLQHMWTTYLAPEWNRVRPMLQDAVDAFQQLKLGDVSRHRAGQLITGQALEEPCWAQLFEWVDRAVFVPSAHVGPYLLKSFTSDTLWVMFGARLPEGIQFHAPDLSRAEILRRLNALADDNRLRILKLVSDSGEQSSQEVMSSLGLSQSTVSRHLQQLTATGYLGERWCEGAKCYKLNPARVKDTLQAMSLYLLGS